MPRRPFIPRYCLHKRSGQAVVFINRTQRYLGPYNSPESREAYGELIAKLAKGVPIVNAEPESSTGGITISGLLLKYVTESLIRHQRQIRQRELPLLISHITGIRRLSCRAHRQNMMDHRHISQ
jgi:hypothetical protein